MERNCDYRKFEVRRFIFFREQTMSLLINVVHTMGVKFTDRMDVQNLR